MLRFSLVIGLVLVALQTGATAGGPSVEGFPPVVIRTVPTSGDQAVDPSLREIRVTFSKDMMTHEMWSFVYANPAPFPKIAGKIHYLRDNRTCVLPVSLEPGKTYGIWINSQEHNSFRDTYQHPAVPYLLVFKTRN
jgi:hypothetical protein